VVIKSWYPAVVAGFETTSSVPVLSLQASGCPHQCEGDPVPDSNPLSSLGTSMSTLEKIDVQLAGIGEVIANKRVAVPSYQRLYAWSDDQVNDLFRDLADAIRKPDSEYFLGTLVLTRTASNAGAQAIIDGQQRLTTASILIAAIRDYFAQNGDRDRAESLQSEYLSKKDFATLEDTPHVRLSAQDHEFYNARVLAPQQPGGALPKPASPSQTLIDRAALTAKKFVDQLVSTTQDARAILIEWVLYIRNKAKVIVVDVANEGNAFTIFEVLNDRGLDLSITDLLKNFLFRMTQDRVSEAQASWVRMSSFLDTLGERDALKTFIRHAWSSTHGLTREKDLYDAIRRHITSKQGAVVFIKNLEKQAITYSALRNPGHECWSPFGATVSQAVEALDTLRATQIRPLLVAVFSNFDAPEIRKALPMLVAWTVRFMIVGRSGSGPLETNYSDRARAISEGEIKTASQLWKGMQQLIPADAEFAEAFRLATVSTQYLARYYLGVIEAYKRSPTSEVIVNPNEERVTLEHIMPQSDSADWTHIPTEQREGYRRRIGNLTLLDKKLNEKAGNISFQAKKQVFSQSDILITKELSAVLEWSPVTIDARQRQFAEIAVKVWNPKPTN
jgi:Protein of unknown function DUF262/Protein of unknown function (DUF1524)